MTTQELEEALKRAEQLGSIYAIEVVFDQLFAAIRTQWKTVRGGTEFPTTFFEVAFYAGLMSGDFMPNVLDFKASLPAFLFTPLVNVPWTDRSMQGAGSFFDPRENKSAVHWYDEDEYPWAKDRLKDLRNPKG